MVSGVSDRVFWIRHSEKIVCSNSRLLTPSFFDLVKLLMKHCMSRFIGGAEYQAQAFSRAQSAPDLPLSLGVNSQSSEVPAMWNFIVFWGFFEV